MLDFENFLKNFCAGAYLANYFLLKQKSTFIDLSQEPVTTVGTKIPEIFIAVRPPNTLIQLSQMDR